MQRRVFLFGIGGAAALAASGYVFTRPAEAETQMTPPQVHQALMENKVILIDVRRPDEWAGTGIAQGAVPLDMREDTFVESVRATMSANPDRPVALICARGVRSRRVAARLALAGITQVIDVPEGMLGSAAGQGWIARGLPLDHRFSES